MILADKAEWLVLDREFWLHPSHYRLRDPNIRQRYIQESSSDSFFDANSIKAEFNCRKIEHETP